MLAAWNALWLSDRMTRVPIFDPAKNPEIARLRRVLAQLEATPLGARERECADVRERDIRMRIEELEKR
ncbi:MAG: hypothetical protein KIT02_10205 [Devosia sp.]|uniref:hypothetical protein n=1 Tax=Devosia sp. TaxID=1871048 RepID=UPI0024C78B47|nr:hypothetical protein [Devosia sp.]UYN98338.1 MAG: hypothetical protein KIT02_10205 [Devosia sp.]